MSKFTEFSFSLRDDDSDDSSADDSGEVSIAVDSDGRIARPAVAGAKRGAAAAGPQRVQGCDFGTRAYDALPSLRDNAKLLEQLRDDCQAVFTSESFWLPHHAKPTCALEQLALGASSFATRLMIRFSLNSFKFVSTPFRSAPQIFFKLTRPVWATWAPRAALSGGCRSGSRSALRDRHPARASVQAPPLPSHPPQ